MSDLACNVLVSILSFFSKKLSKIICVGGNVRDNDTPQKEKDRKTQKQSSQEKTEQKRLQIKKWPVLKLPKIYPVSFFVASALALFLMISAAFGFSVLLSGLDDDLVKLKSDGNTLNSSLMNLTAMTMIVPQKVNRQFLIHSEQFNNN